MNFNDGGGGVGVHAMMKGSGYGTWEDTLCRQTCISRPAGFFVATLDGRVAFTTRFLFNYRLRMLDVYAFFVVVLFAGYQARRFAIFDCAASDKHRIDSINCLFEKCYISVVLVQLRLTWPL